MLRKLLSLTLAILLLCGLALPASAASAEALAAADALNALGLFGGVGTNADGSTNYDLDRAPTRHEAVTMLVRLLGKETEAMSKTWRTPLTDVDDWAQPYVGYAYNNGLTTGISATAFGGNQSVTAAQYLTFVLRALGYVSGEDFQWDKAWELTDRLGITHGQYNAANNSAFQRADVVLVSNAALSATLKGTNATLLSQVQPKDRYQSFAAEILAQGGTEHVLKVSNDSVGSAELKRLVGDYDLYLVSGRMPPADDPLLREKLLAIALEDYANACTDGNFADSNSGNVSAGILPFAPCGFLLTDGRGFITGWCLYGKDAKEVTVVTCEIDTREWIKGSVAEFSDLWPTLTEASCTMSFHEDKILYEFSNLPAGAVSFTDILSGNADPEDVDVQNAVSKFYSDLQRGRYSTSDLSAQVLGYKFSETEKTFKIFVFLDANDKLVGYCLATMKQ